jgi:putative ABC transport system permease protein
LAEVQLNGYVAAFAIASALLVGFVTGLVPAVSGRIGDVGRAIREGQRGSVGDRRHGRVRGILVCVEVALALILMIGAGLLVRSLSNLMSVDRGFQTERRLLATVSIPRAYPDQRREQIAVDILTQIQNRPEVESAADISGRPLSRGSTGLGIVAAEAPPTENVPWASWRVVTKDYFKTLGLPLVSGRHFSEQDIVGKPWRVIISRRLANLLWPGQDPIGRTAILWKGQGDNHAEVVGVVGDMRERGLDTDPTLAVYFPAYGGLDGTTHQLIIHTRSDPKDFSATLRAIVSGIDPTLPISNVLTLEQVVSNSVGARRFTMLLLFTFAAVALILALAGVYGIVTYSVARRIPEVGVRLALGAKPRDVLSLIVRQGMRPVGVGIVCGLFAVLWLSRFMTTLLFGVKAGDPLTYVAVLTGLALIAVAACYVPARRVLRVDPVIALRSE